MSNATTHEESLAGMKAAAAAKAAGAKPATAKATKRARKPKFSFAPARPKILGKFSPMAVVAWYGCRKHASTDQIMAALSAIAADMGAKGELCKRSTVTRYRTPVKQYALPIVSTEDAEALLKFLPKPVAAAPKAMPMARASKQARAKYAAHVKAVKAKAKKAKGKKRAA